MPDCPKCHGTGFYQYDDNHSTFCEVCCPHDQGRWQLSLEFHGTDKWCCKRGCGKTWEARDEG